MYFILFSRFCVFNDNILCNVQSPKMNTFFKVRSIADYLIENLKTDYTLEKAFEQLLFWKG